MAATRRAKSPPVAEQLFEEGWRFDFFQAVKILEYLAEDAGVPGECIFCEDEPVTLHGHASQGFPASDIEQVLPAPDAEGKPTLHANILNLAGAQGPLPPPYTELLLERTRRGDTAFREFLEIFQHRFLSLFYRARKHLRLGLETKAPWDSHFANYLYAFMGLGTDGLLKRRQLPDHNQLFYAGLFVSEARSLNALEAMLSDFLQTTVQVEPFQGQWEALPVETQTRIGVGWQNQRLGENVVAGTRSWNQQAKFNVALGPLNFEQFSALLPGKQGYAYVCELIRAFAGPEQDFDLRLELRADEVPTLSLGQRSAQLGWTTWPQTDPATKNPIVTLSTKKFFLRGVELPHPILGKLSKKEQENFLNRMTLKHYPAGVTLLRQGVRNHYLYLLCSGTVKVTQRQADDSVRLLATVKAGTTLGEMGLLNKRPTSATVETSSTCSLYQVPQAYVEHLMQDCPDFSEALQRIILKR